MTNLVHFFNPSATVDEHHHINPIDHIIHDQKLPHGYNTREDNAMIDN